MTEINVLNNIINEINELKANNKKLQNEINNLKEEINNVKSELDSLHVVNWGIHMREGLSKLCDKIESIQNDELSKERFFRKIRSGGIK